MFRKILCAVGLHDWHTVDTTACFTTCYADKPTWGETRHFVWYDKCQCCGKRRLRDTSKKDNHFGDRHNGIEQARVWWVEREIMYLGSGNYKNPPVPTIKTPNLTVLKGGKNDSC